MSDNKKAQAQIIVVVAVIGLFVAVIVLMVWLMTGGLVTEQAAGSQLQEVVAETKSGDVAQIKVDVRDMANDDVNTKLAVAIYCVDSKGDFVIDGTTSSTSTRISGSTTRGEMVTCYAFSSTIQTYQPFVGEVKDEILLVTIDAYTLSVLGSNDFFDDTFTVSDNGTQGSNISITTSGGRDTYQKMKFTNKGTNSFLRISGFYFDTVVGSNISIIDITGSASVSKRAVTKDSGATSIVNSDLTSSVSSRKDKLNFIFEIDDGNPVLGNEGFQGVLLDESDFLETGIVAVESDGSSGCVGKVDKASLFGFSKGFYREKQGEGIGYDWEDDAISAAVISTDMEAEFFNCAPV